MRQQLECRPIASRIEASSPTIAITCNTSPMWNKTKINFKVDPPPDLAIEVEVTCKLSDKIDIYAAFRVPELWRWSGGKLPSTNSPRMAGTLIAKRAFAFRTFPSPKRRNSCGSWGRSMRRCSLALSATGCGRTYGRVVEGGAIGTAVLASDRLHVARRCQLSC